jgi:hypothetical protein
LQDKRAIEPKRREFETVLNDIEHQTFTNPQIDPLSWMTNPL